MSTAVTETKSAAPAAAAATTPKKTFKELLGTEQFKAQLQSALPKHLTPDRFIRVVLTAGMKNPKLFECTQESLFRGILELAAVGLEPDGRRAHLIPFRNNSKNCMEVQTIVDYKGLAELAMRSGHVSNIHADIVCAEDVFKVNAGELVEHTVDYKKERGKAYAAYCIIRMKDGGQKLEVMSRHEIEKIRDRSKSKNAGPWVTDWDEMAKKTVARRAFKWVPLSPEVQRVFETEDNAIDISTVPGKTLSGGIGALIDGAQAAGELTAGAAEGEGVQQDGAGDVDQTAAAEKEYSAADREIIVKMLEGMLLDKGIDEKKAFKMAGELKAVPEGVDEFWNLPTAALAKVRDHLTAAPAGKGSK